MAKLDPTLVHPKAERLPHKVTLYLTVETARRLEKLRRRRVNLSAVFAAAVALLTDDE